MVSPPAFSRTIAGAVGRAGCADSAMDMTCLPSVSAYWDSLPSIMGQTTQNVHGPESAPFSPWACVEKVGQRSCGAWALVRTTAHTRLQRSRLRAAVLGHWLCT